MIIKNVTPVCSTQTSVDIIHSKISLAGKIIEKLDMK